MSGVMSAKPLLPGQPNLGLNIEPRSAALSRNRMTFDGEL